MDMDNRAVCVLRTLEMAGYEAYLVGGCVRDMLMGRRIHDYDVTTSALPEQTMELFSNTVPTGIKHGTVTVKWDELAVEVTTFRSDGEYTDKRHPDSIRFVSGIEEDLKRRDFTINSIAMSADGKLIDPFGGREDISRRLIRTVGNPAIRFGEDALRMYRCIRFAAELGFEIHGDTLKGISACAVGRFSVSGERICSEIDRILMSPAPHLLDTAAKAGLLDKTGSINACQLDGLPKNVFCLWGGFIKWLSPGDVNLTLSRLHVSKSLREAVVRGISCSDMVADKLSVKKIIAMHGYDTAQAACGAAQVAGVSEAAMLPEQIERSGECCTLRDLAVNGNDLLSVGYTCGKLVGQEMQKLLSCVICSPEKNRHDFLLDIACDDLRTIMPQGE